MNTFRQPAELRAPSRFRCLGLRGGTHHGVQLRGRLKLHRRYDMRVRVERDADLRVAKTLLNHLGMNAGSEQECGRGVPQVVEADSRQTGRAQQRLEMVHVEVGAP